MPVEKRDEELWKEIFPFSPYPEQKAGIRRTINIAKDGGFHLLEGACGTGKTLLALTSGLSLVRNSDTSYEQVMILTSVKQQTKQFEKDLESINRNLGSDTEIDNFSSLTLVGKSDVCPYTRQGLIDDKEIYDKCTEYRNQVREYVSQETSNSSKSKSEVSEMLVSHAQTDGETLEVAGVEAEFGKSVPKLPSSDPDSDSYSDSKLDKASDNSNSNSNSSDSGEEYCPFYARHRAKIHGDRSVLSYEDEILTPERLVQKSASQGSCPHSAMDSTLDKTEVVISNYKHAFDPLTVNAFTKNLLDEETFLICDEAHMLIDRVRDELSRDASLFSLRSGAKEMIDVIDMAEGSYEASNINVDVDAEQLDRDQRDETEIAQRVMDEYGLGISDFAKASNLIQEIISVVDEIVSEHLEEKEEEENKFDPRRSPDSTSDDKITIPLRDPETTYRDKIRRKLDTQGYDDVLRNLDTVGKVTEEIIESVEVELYSKSGESVKHAPIAASLLHSWFEKSHTEYFREIHLKPKPRTGSPSTDKETNTDIDTDSDSDTVSSTRSHQSSLDSSIKTEDWQESFSARLYLNNCIPSDEIRQRLDDFGGGVLMSATLSPLDVYKSEIGLKHNLSKDDSRSLFKRRTTENSNRSIKAKETVFSLNFPPENRHSIIVDAEPFTYSNRGSVNDTNTNQNQNQTRSKYLNVLKDVVTETPGNTLVCMPSYAESEWIHSELKSDTDIDKDILSDESTDTQETQKIKKEFFEGDPKVLTTSLRGTLTEGVDYEGERLLSVVVVGVPIANTKKDVSTAIQTAYDKRFGSEKGFDYSFKVPAVRKARQALGRVIRGEDDVGVRVLVDGRYAEDESWESVREYLPEHEKEEYTVLQPDEVRDSVKEFWE